MLVCEAAASGGLSEDSGGLRWKRVVILLTWEIGLGWQKEPSEDLGEMLIRAMSRHCIFLPIPLV